jgi:hypothetical protein
MKHQFLLFIAVLFSTCFYAQGQDSLNKSIYFGGTAELNRNFRITSATQELANLETELDSLERATAGIRFGLFAGKSITKKIAVEAGLFYSRFGYNIDTLLSANLFNLNYRFHFAEIPVRFAYSFNLGKSWKMNACAGVRSAFLFSSTLAYRSLEDRTQQRVKEETPKNNFQVLPWLGVDFTKKISNQYSMRLEVNYSQAITSLSNSDLKRNLFSSAIGFSLYRQL